MFKHKPDGDQAKVIVLRIYVSPQKEIDLPLETTLKKEKP